MAGTAVRPGAHHAGDLPPRIDLEFRLVDGQGAVVKQGRRVLRDPLYLTRAATSDSDRLRYDKQLLGDWLRQEFGARS